MAIRIAMWSGPRNISTAMMRAFENRRDTAVWDEPFYAAFLKLTGANHPMRDDILAHHPADWRAVAAAALGPVPGDARIFYQKHMTHHMVPAIGRDWMDHRELRHAFLIREPQRVIASYAAKMEEIRLEALGFTQQVELFERVADRLGKPPPVVDGADVLKYPRTMLTRLCEELGIGFDDAMLSWPPGRRSSDGIWAAHWYQAVEASTGFTAPASEQSGGLSLPAHLQALADRAQPCYERLAAHALPAPNKDRAD